VQKYSKAKFAIRAAHFLASKIAAFAVTWVVAIGVASAADYLPPGTLPPEVAPVAPGSGGKANPLIGGDGGVPPAPPTGKAISPPPNGSRFRTIEERALQTHDNYYLNKDGRGRRLIMQTPPEEEGEGEDFETQNALEDYDRIHYPYPPTVPGKAFQKSGGKPRATKAVDRDTKKRRFGRDDPNKAWADTERDYEPLPIVRRFCRKIVILGVVFATVYMAFAAFSVVLGHREGGQRVIGTAAGLMLLLMGYSIFKVVQINAWRYFLPGEFDETYTGFENKKQPLKKANTPVIPPEPGGQKRSNLPVQPLTGPAK
jgi:hypothetical protein